MSGIGPWPFSRKCSDRLKGKVARVEGADAIPVRNVVQEKRRHRRQVSEGNPLHEISDSSLFILRKICCKSSCCAVLMGSRGRLGTPGSKPSSSIAYFSPEMPCLDVTAFAAGAMMR